MSEEQHNDSVYNYGVPRDFYTSVRWLGMRIVDLLFVVGTPVATVQFAGGGRVFPIEQVWQFWSFVLLSFLIPLFLVLPHNHGKNNLSAIRIFLTRRRRKYISIERFKNHS